tara:strand:- start:300 stop:794 length:495 start_codon:yes stop_codon:yes gene_type:complete
MKGISLKLENRRLIYFAYGMNTNLNAMSYRCPDAILIGKAVIAEQKLIFRSVADYTHSPNNNLYGVLWSITQQCENSLDILEGFPNLYKKENKICLLVDSYNSHFSSGIFKTMIYKMNSKAIKYPSSNYLECLSSGYIANNLPKSQLKDAINDININGEKLENY